jgi:hypothetical protein
MPNDLTIQAAAQSNPGSGVTAPVKAAATPAPVEQTAPMVTDAPNPTLALNAALGLVVIEFRNTAGAVVSTIPTTQQIQAYQHWQDSGIGRPPNLGASMSNSAPASASAPASSSDPTSASAPASAPAPVHAQASAPASAPAAFGGNGYSTHLGIGV